MTDAERLDLLRRQRMVLGETMAQLRQAVPGASWRLTRIYQVLRGHIRDVEDEFRALLRRHNGV